MFHACKFNEMTLMYLIKAKIRHEFIPFKQIPRLGARHKYLVNMIYAYGKLVYKNALNDSTYCE